MEVKEESENAGLKLNIQKMNIMASSPITSWQIDGQTMESDRLYFLRLQNHCRCDCSHEIKRSLLLGRNDMTSLDSMLKSKGTIYQQILSSQSYGLSSSHVWMWELDHKQRLDTKEFIFLNCDVGKDSWEPVGQEGDQISQS